MTTQQQKFLLTIADKLDLYLTACNQLASKFIIEYFSDCNYSDYNWVADDVGGVLNVNDFYFSMADIVEAMKVRPTQKQLFDYYDYCMNQHLKQKNIDYNLKNFIKKRYENPNKTL